MSDTATPRVTVSVRNLTVRAGGRLLLDRTSAEFPAGEITLIVGPSGAGKSVLLRILAGLIRPDDPDFDISGEIAMGDGAGVGIVFQGFALFDELSARGNILFARDHRRGRSDAKETRAEVAARLLEDFDIPTTVPVAFLSGGQKQRLAIARTLAYDADVLVFDEPTSGLDPLNATRVAERIRITRDRFEKTTVIVTHDYDHLAAIADRVYFLDTTSRTLCAVSPVEMDGLWTGKNAAPATATTGPAAAARVTPTRVPRIDPARIARRLGGGIAAFLAATTRVVEATLVSLALVVPVWRSARWGLRALRHALGLVAAPSAFAYFGAAGIIAGFVSTHFTFKFLPFKAYTEPLITEELLHGLGFSLYRIVVPVLLTVLLAARCGAAVAADIGGRNYNHQIEAMRSLGAPPGPYLLTGVLHAFLLGTPLLVTFGFLVARFTSLVIFSYNYPEHESLLWDSHFHRHLRVPGSMLYLGTGWMLLKILTCSFGVGAIAYHVGMRPKRSSVEVSRGITTTIIWATLFVLVVHFIFAFVEF